MNHLPKLSAGVQRTAGLTRTILGRGTAGAQAQSISPPMFHQQPGGDLGFIGPTLPSGGSAALALELPFYGKYCGPGHGDPSHCSPDDQVDAVCCQHDHCYEDGYFDCGCDCDLVRSMPSAIANTASADGKDIGAKAMAFFAVSPCSYGNILGVPLPFPGGPLKCLLF
jgi:hypothetical protein